MMNMHKIKSCINRISTHLDNGRLKVENEILKRTIQEKNNEKEKLFAVIDKQYALIKQLRSENRIRNGKS